MVSLDLDSNIRDFVLIPMFIVVVCSSALRVNLLQLFKQDMKVAMKEMKSNNTLARCKMLKMHGQYLSEKAWKTRRAFYTKKDVGLLWKAPKTNPMAAMQSDPSAATGMLKTQMIFIFMQGGLYTWVSHLFSGFLVAKTPFPLTFRFGSMLQRGVEVASLDVTYVSSLSWYFIILMTSSGLLAFIGSWKKENTASDDDLNPLGPMAGMGAQQQNPMGGGPDLQKVFASEREALEIYPHESIVDNAEDELWAKWCKKK